MMVKLEKWHAHVRDFCARHPDWRIKLSIREVLLLCRATYVQDEEELETICAVETVSSRDDFINLL